MVDRILHTDGRQDTGAAELRHHAHALSADRLVCHPQRRTRVAILGFFGVETTTFAALLAAGGVAIGVAWGGLLSNFGRSLPRLPASLQGGGLHHGGRRHGHVDAIGLFGTTINTPDNVQTIVGDNGVFSGHDQAGRH